MERALSDVGLFQAGAPTELLPGIMLYEGALPDADALYAQVMSEAQLSQEHLSFGARTVPMPRLTAWYGDAGASYTYSGLRNEPLSWTPTLNTLRGCLSEHLGTKLNSCLLNYYEDGSKSIGWHRDAEPELRDRIVSVSFGADRTFMLRLGRKGEPMAHILHHGSVLTMTVASQKDCFHCVPKEEASGPRLNLTFRTVEVATA